MVCFREKTIQELKDACFVITMALLFTTAFTILFMWIGALDVTDTILYTIKLYVKASYIMLSISLAIFIIEIIYAIDNCLLRIKQLTSYQIQDQ